MALNKNILMGRLVKDVEFKTVGEGTPKASFIIAVDKNYKPKDESQPTADFIPIVAWRKKAEFANKYFCKGMRIVVCGRIETYTLDRPDGTKEYKFHINAEELEFADSLKKDKGKNDGEEKPNSTENNDFPDDFPQLSDFIDDDLPF